MKIGRVGQQIVKRSGKPFKSGDKIGTIAALCCNLQHPRRVLAYVMKEDESIVNVDICTEIGV